MAKHHLIIGASWLFDYCAL